MKDYILSILHIVAFMPLYVALVFLWDYFKDTFKKK